MNELPNKLLISVHDVMPETLESVRGIVDAIERYGRRPATLLVVPGRDWRPAQIDELRRYRDRGHELAGHGWTHEAAGPPGLWHRLTGYAAGTHAAEHLGCDSAGVADIIRRCRGWFDDHQLGEPQLYVPPAWTMGRIRRLDIRRLGFRFFEYSSGYYDARIGVFQRVPHMGFDAETALRAAVLRFWNRASLNASHRYGWLRVAIHPRDPDLRMGADLTGVIRQMEGAPALVSELFDNGPPETAPAPERAGGRVRAGEASGVG